MQHGTVKWFSSDEGYGFFSTDSGDVFFHVSSIEGLEEGAPAMFEVTPGPHGPIALGVVLGRDAAGEQSSTRDREDSTDHSDAARATFHSDGTATFRGIEWSATKAHVRASHPEPAALDAPDLLAYDGAIAGMPARVIYIFVDDQLARGKYVVDRSSSDQYIRDFDELDRLLRRKYGEPEVNDYWRDAEDSGESHRRASAVSVGELSMFRSWVVGECEVILGIASEDYEIELGIEYTFRGLSELESSQREMNLLRDL